MIFNAIKPYGSFRTEGGGVSGIETALWDLVGKVYGVPCWQFMGGKYRDTVRIYADTPEPEDADASEDRWPKWSRGRKEMGLTIIKVRSGAGWTAKARWLT